MKKGKQRPIVYAVSLVILAIVAVLCTVCGDSVNDGMVNISSVITNNFAWLYMGGTLFMIILAFMVFGTPLSNVRVGGRDAKPLVNKFTYFAIVVCTLIGAGLPTWACAEVMAHYSAPPTGIEAFSFESAKFAMRSILNHWTVAPLAQYAVTIIPLAFIFYNRKSKIRISSLIEPCLNRKLSDNVSAAIDGIAIFIMLSGLAVGISVAVDVLTSGMYNLTGGAISKTPVTITFLIGFTVVFYTISTSTGLQKGIKWLSNINIYLLTGVALVVLIVGPTVYCLNFGLESTGAFINNIFTEMTELRTFAGDTWAYSWPVYTFAYNLAWSLTASVFIARSSYGYKFKDILVYGFILPTSFIAFWIWIFSSTALYFESHTGGLVDAYNNLGYSSVVTKVFQQLPAGAVISVVFLLIVFLSLVTSCDSCVNAIAGLCTEQDERGTAAEPGMSAKLFWAVLVGVVSWAVSFFMNINGLKACLIIGAFPSLIITLMGCLSLWKIMWNPKRYDSHKSDYDANGKPILDNAGEIDLSEDFQHELKLKAK